MGLWFYLQCWAHICSFLGWDHLLHCGGNSGKLQASAHSKSLAPFACGIGAALDRILGWFSLCSELYLSRWLRFLPSVVEDTTQVLVCFYCSSHFFLKRWCCYYFMILQWNILVELAVHSGIYSIERCATLGNQTLLLSTSSSTAARTRSKSILYDTFRRLY